MTEPVFRVEDAPQEWHPLVLRWPSAPGLPVPAGQWRRLADGRVEASYGSREELALCVALAREIAEMKLYQRKER